MSIPAKITAELASLQAQVVAAGPLTSAPRATVIAIKLNAATLVADVQAALVAPSSLDSWTSPGDPAAIAAGILALAETTNDLNTLALMRGVVGRAASNLDQIPS